MSFPRPSAKKRPVRQVTAAYLEKVAFWYIERYASSVASLRRVLMRRVHKSAAVHGTDMNEAQEWINQILAKCQKLGLVSDDRYTESKVINLRRRGASRRAIWQKLQAKGVSDNTIQKALSQYDQDSPDAELEAAHAYARRRRLGPYRPAAVRAAFKAKDMAALAQAGFSYGVAQKVLHEEER